MPRIWLDEVTRRVAELFGTYQGGVGKLGYQQRYEFPYGAFIAFSNDDRPEMCIDINGGGCSHLGHDTILDLLRWMTERDGKATRIDISVDFRADRVGLIDAVLGACDARQLCRCRRWDSIENNLSDGQRAGRGVQMGRRGKNGSGRFVRVYDKGLESGEETEGKWERWETEFSKDAAAQVARNLSASEDWKSDALSVALGAVDFREHTGERSLERRPRSAWWATLLDAVRPVVVKVRRRVTNTTRYLCWLKRCVVPTMQTVAKLGDISTDDLLAYVTSGKYLGKPPEHLPPIVTELLNELADFKSIPERVRDGSVLVARKAASPSHHGHGAYIPHEGLTCKGSMSIIHA